MNFIAAIQHASIGYGIRRKTWAERDNCWVYLKNNELWWADGNAVDRCSYLCPKSPDLAIDILPEDIAATDWETV